MSQREPTLRLRLVLQRLITDHERLLECIEQKMDAIRAADLDALAQVVREEAALVRRISSAETQRRRIMALAGDASTIRAIAEKVGPPQDEELLRTADRLREVVGRVHERADIVRQAAVTLERHVDGVIRTLQAALGRAGVYGDRGEVRADTGLPMHVDVTS